MKNMRIISGILTAAVLSGAASGAHSIESVGSQAQPLTLSGGTARATSMGSAVVAVPQGAASLLWNPAALSTMTCSEVSLHHNNGLAGAIQEIGIIGVPLGALGGAALSMNYTDNGSFEGRDIAGNKVGSYRAGSYGLSIGWGVEVLPNVSAGVAARANWQNLAGKYYSAYSSDLGLLWHVSRPLYVGLTYTNINLAHRVAGYSVNQGWRLGAAYTFNEKSRSPLLLSAAVEKQDVGVTRLQAGAESWVTPKVALRAGYALNTPDNKVDGFSGLTLGLGVKLHDFMLDYGYIPLGDIGTSHRLSLTFKFDCQKERPAVAALPLVEKIASPRAASARPARPTSNRIPARLTPTMRNPICESCSV